jgi:hypothetical protein
MFQKILKSKLFYFLKRHRKNLAHLQRVQVIFTQKLSLISKIWVGGSEIRNKPIPDPGPATLL